MSWHLNCSILLRDECSWMVHTLIMYSSWWMLECKLLVPVTVMAEVVEVAVDCAIESMSAMAAVSMSKGYEEPPAVLLGTD